jgi:hypothetical protein
MNVLWLKGSGTVQVILDLLSRKPPAAYSGIGPYRRPTEMQVSEVVFVDRASAEFWDCITEKRVNLVPYATAASEYRRELEAQIRQYYRITGPLAFLHLNLTDNPGKFSSPLRIRVLREGDNFVIEGWSAVAVSDSIAYLSELLDPVSIILGLKHGNMMEQSLNYLECYVRARRPIEKRNSSISVSKSRTRKTFATRVSRDPADENRDPLQM